MSLQFESILPHRVAVDCLQSSKGPRSSPSQKQQKLRYGARVRSGFRLSQGRAGDHLLIYALLQSLMQSSSESEFQWNLDRPDYEPTQRLLLWRGDDLVGHIRLARRMIRWRNAWLPTCDLSEFALLPEFAQEDQRVRLLQAAAEDAADAGALLLTCRTYGDVVPPDSSWIANGSVLSYSESPRTFLANCAAFEEQYPELKHFRVRPWRYVEQRELAEIYDANTAQVDGSPIRDEEYWRWLLTRRGFDEILVVTMKSEERAANREIQDTILGYAFVRGNDIVEITVVPERPESALPLLQRVAADAIERNDHFVRLFRPAWTSSSADLLDRLIGLSDKRRSCETTQAVFAADPLGLLEVICQGTDQHLVKSVDNAGVELDLAGQRVWIGPSREGRLEMKKRSLRSKACCIVPPEDVTRFLCGCLADDRSSKIEFPTAAIRREITNVFQPVTLWRSTLDDLPSSN